MDEHERLSKNVLNGTAIVLLFNISQWLYWGSPTMTIMNTLKCVYLIPLWTNGSVSYSYFKRFYCCRNMGKCVLYIVQTTVGWQQKARPCWNDKTRNGYVDIVKIRIHLEAIAIVRIPTVL